MKNCKLFFDNWFTSVGLVCELQKVGILSTPDIRDTSGPAQSVPCIRISLITSDGIQGVRTGSCEPVLGLS